MNQIRMAGLALALTAGMAFATAPALACGPDENMMHVGVVVSVSGSEGTLVLVDAQTGKHLTFKVTPDQIKQVAANARVVIHYSEDGDQLVAEEIKV